MGLGRPIHEALRRQILTGRLRPGDRLVEGELARAYGVSKSPLREALKTLQHEGLVEAIPRRGYLVTPITVKQVQDLFDLRLILERETAHRAARSAGPEQVAELRRLVGDPYVVGDVDSQARFLAQNKAFHLAVARLAGNQRLVTLLDRLLDDLERLFHLGLDVRDRAQALVAEHVELVDAVTARDPDRAARVVEAQIGNARQMVLEGILEGALSVQVG
ncbi:MAG: GntR family transcriptional regulator [Armatimonadota bacterium]|nr:GntR family transcriptional regulator [Armatimonadota bacterium]MDR7422898.1 GntR family transcriptional regulator [Armatimonadota bacterium]MDR7452909.1 GntR family transcriptional regulator [Armatimonadota bacterium]MDR7455657.1 GntR family transcriptional regulator [Armatimonadota bacterium]MDR7497378.1 GntR family transcriptional regulator [Armatimonadota bacterium]